METYLLFFVLIVNVTTSVFGTLLPQYIFQENCRNTIDFLNAAGEITFKSSNVFYSSSRDRQCDVRLSAKRPGNRYNQVMFYFTEFDLGARCHDINLTVYDGRYSTKIKGLSDALCGHNTSLEESKPVFISTRNEIRLLLRWNEYGERFSGSFKLTFIPFYKGPCSGEDNTFTCSNDRCIASNTSCNMDINYCGNGQDVICDEYKQLAESFVNTLLATMKDIGVVVAIIVGFAIVKICIFDYCKQRYGSIKNVPIIRNLFKDSDNRPTDISADTMSYNANSRRSSIQASERNHVEADQISIALSEETLYSLTDDPPSYDTFNHDDNLFPSPETGTPHDQEEPTAPPISSMTLPPPPPSYEDVMSNTDQYVK